MAQGANDITGKIVRGLSDLADALANGEPLSEQFTCRRVIVDLNPLPYHPDTIKSTRRLLRASQGVFAAFLGVKVSTIQAWEQGKQSPSILASRFMDEIQRNPDYWRTRLRDSIRVKA